MRTTTTTQHILSRASQYRSFDSRFPPRRMFGNSWAYIGAPTICFEQIAIDPSTGNLIIDNIEDETHQVFKNIKAVLTEAEMTLENVVKCSVFVSDMEMYGRINAVYAQYFNEENAPARELVEVVNLPKYVNVEISCIAV